MIFPRNKQMLSVFLAGSILLTGCIHEKDEDNSITASSYYAVVATSSNDYKSYDVSLISLEDYSVANDIFNTQADIDVATNADDIFVIGRLGTDNISKYTVDDSGVTKFEYQYAMEQNSNPQDVVVKSESAAYVIRYDTKTIKIVDPSADSAAAFETGSLDLSDYSADDGGAEAADGLLIDNKLFVIIQGWDRSGGWPWAAGDSYVAVFDTITGQEIDTNADTSTPKGIKLITKNPVKMVYESVSGKIYIASRGADYDGGIEALDVATYTTSLIVDDGTSGAAPYGKITNVAILSASKGYFVGSAAYLDDALYAFNPTTGKVDETPLVNASNLADIAIGPKGNLWVANRSLDTSGVTIFDTVDNSVLKPVVETGLLPMSIEFLSVRKND